MRSLKSLAILLVLLAAAWFWHRPAPPQAAAPQASQAEAASAALPAFLPPEARDTLARIARGGPFEHRQDGSVFGNREGMLPAMPRGYYREYTVETPGLGYRGARRIIAGGDPPEVYYYTDDHYRSFRRFQAAR
ncbi:ribonuclease [Frateuria sp. Soil773]|uniref:ribonuclease domain-containing protein n=1 Tax=Frateuria sp. Soil773 TaxID=1736407 RepID=UPI0006F747BD|nr:ribonuclease domain-containing protein [Frateuria sp. Soil773]KRE92502.1 ribonuclease [Frateuria sp. Soil773]